MKKDWMVNESELDEDQIRILMAQLDKSCVVSGCAGSGKSVLALIKAQRIQKERGNDYKIIVYTKALCHYMNAGKKELGLTNDFYYHEEWKWKKVPKRYGYMGTLMVYDRDEDGNKVPYKPAADYIIVDEIQDFSEDEIQEFIAATRKNFFFFGDTAQSIYGDMKPTVPVDHISRYIVPRSMPVKDWELYRNYRLPIPVARLVQQVGINLQPYDEHTYKSKIKSIPRFLKYTNKEVQLQAIHDIIEKNNLSDVAILLPHGDNVKEVYDQLSELGGDYELRYNGHCVQDSEDTLNFSTSNPKIMTYHSSKGLQFETVFLPYIEDFGGTDNDRKALYVAMTRTYNYLYVMYSGCLPAILDSIDPSLYKTTEIDDNIEDI